MKEFGGFPGKAKFTPVPNLFFTEVLPQIDDIAELKITLHIFWALYQKQDYPRFVTYNELAASPVLARSLWKEAPPDELLQKALDKAIGRCTLLHLSMEHNNITEAVYFLNTEESRRAIEKIERGELKLEGFARSKPQATSQVQPNIFTLYEQNIGLLSPIIAEELAEAEKTYPQPWIHDAFREAVELNKRNWRYISRILERWASEGKDDGEYRRHSKTESDPEEYYRRYGHFLKK